MAIEIVRATRANAVQLTQIAHSAKSFWGYPSRWIELWRNQLTVSGDYIDTHEVYAAMDAENFILGFYALSSDRSRLTLEHLWVQPSSFGAGVGRALFMHAVDRGRQMGAAMLELESDPHAEGFYQRMGAVTVGEVTYEMEGQLRSLPLLVMPLAPAAPSAQSEGE